MDLKATSTKHSSYRKETKYKIEHDGKSRKHKKNKRNIEIQEY